MDDLGDSSIFAEAGKAELRGKRFFEYTFHVKGVVENHPFSKLLCLSYPL